MGVFIILCAVLYFLNRPLDLILTFLIWPFHELGHFVAGKILGIKGQTLSVNWFQANISYDLEGGNFLTPLNSSYYFFAGMIVNLVQVMIYTCFFGNGAFYASISCLLMIFLNLMPFFDWSDGHSIVSLMSQGKHYNFKSLSYFFVVYGSLVGVLMISIPKVHFFVSAIGYIGLIVYLILAYKQLDRVKELDFVKSVPTQVETAKISTLTLFFCVSLLLLILSLKLTGYGI
ncbi:MAG: hypothetical protein ACRCXZ_00500 [Patescibacteria group bacterium]